MFQARVIDRREAVRTRSNAAEQDLTKFINNRNRENDEEWTQGEIASRVKLLNEKWARYEAAKDIEDLNADLQSSSTLLDSRVSVCESYLLLMDKLLNRERRIRTELSQAQASTTDNGNADVAPNLYFHPYTERESFHNFIDRFEVFLRLKNTTEGKHKVFILLQALTPELYRTLSDLVAPDKPKYKSYHQLVNALKGYFNPEKSTWEMRGDFISAVQGADETVRDYASRLRRLAAKCKFNCTCDAFTSDVIIKLHFVGGLKDSDVRNRLLKENDEKTFPDLVEIAYNVEQAKMDDKNPYIDCLCSRVENHGKKTLS